MVPTQKLPVPCKVDGITLSLLPSVSLILGLVESESVSSLDICYWYK